MKFTAKKAQSLIEYGLILALVAVIAVSILGKFGASITATGNRTTESLDAASNNAANNYCAQLGNQVWSSAQGKCVSSN